MNRRCARHRGLSLLELMLALSVTAMVAAAISSMLAVVSVGIDTQRDSRSLMLRGQAAQVRLAAYIAPAQCLLDVDGGDCVIWVSDDRQSGTVHATELRWLRHDADNGAYDVHFVSFPDGWTQVQRDLADLEYPSSTDWEVVYQTYLAQGHISAVTLLDNIASMTPSHDEAIARDSRIVQYEMTFTDMDPTAVISVSSAIRLHNAPEA
ncbi:MAG: prepilin-type N-terminal cleavage/methylation domain-containing protein [Planctomycetota bacterium]